MVGARVTIRHGTVVGVSAGVMAESRDRDSQVEVIAAASAWPRLEHYRAPDEHPNLYVSSAGRNACSGCVVTAAAFTPPISRGEFLQITDFDLSCFTKLGLCHDSDEMLPQVKRIADEDERRTKSRDNNAPVCTERAIRTLGRDSLRVVVLDGDVVEASGGFDYKVVQRLKWTEFGPGHIRQAIDPLQWSSKKAFAPGERLIVFFWTPGSSCDVVPATAENLAAVNAGIAEDKTEEWHWSSER